MILCAGARERELVVLVEARHLAVVVPGGVAHEEVLTGLVFGVGAPETESVVLVNSRLHRARCLNVE